MLLSIDMRESVAKFPLDTLLICFRSASVTRDPLGCGYPTTPLPQFLFKLLSGTQFLYINSASSAPSEARLSQLGESPSPVSPGKARVPSVALTPVTSSVKRTQGNDGPQCVSVKGLSPVMNNNRGCRRLWKSGRPHRRSPSPWLPRVHRGLRPWHVIKAELGTREIP